MNDLGEKIGQLFLVGIGGESLTAAERATIEDCSFGGFILYSRNCSDAAQILSLCRALWETGTELPAFIAIDQEGGRVHRLPKPFTHFPAAGALGRAANPDLAYRAGRATAVELALLGINLNFAPVFDVNSNPANPIIGDRAFGENPARVIEYAGTYARGLRDGGVIPCGKHFPGHGDTDKDSHLDLPVVEKSQAALNAVELPPFAVACARRIEALLTAHVLYPALDREFPATLSEKIVTGVLRHEWGYGGVVFSDDMEMKAISDHYGEEEAVALALRAGIDVILYCHDLLRAARACEYLVAEAEREPALRARVEESYRRIAKLKQDRLTGFTGAAAAELTVRLARLDHRRIVEAIQGSL